MYFQYCSRFKKHFSGGICLTLSHIQMFSDTSAADDVSNFLLCKHIFQIFSTIIFSFFSFIKNFPYVCIDVFKVFCCRFVVCLKNVYVETAFSVSLVFLCIDANRIRLQFSTLDILQHCLGIYFQITRC